MSFHKSSQHFSSAQELSFLLTRNRLSRSIAIKAYHSVGMQLARRWSQIPGVQSVFLRGGSWTDCDPALSDIDFTLILNSEEMSPTVIAHLQSKYHESKMLFPMLGEILIFSPNFWKFSQLLPTPVAHGHANTPRYREGESVKTEKTEESSELSRFLAALIPYFANHALVPQTQLERARFFRNAKKAFDLLQMPHTPATLASAHADLYSSIEIKAKALEADLNLSSSAEVRDPLDEVRSHISGLLSVPLLASSHPLTWIAPRLSEKQWQDWMQIRKNLTLPSVALIPPTLGCLMNGGLGNPASARIPNAPLPDFLHVLYASNLIPIISGLCVTDLPSATLFWQRARHHLQSLQIETQNELPEGLSGGINALLRCFPISESLE